MSWIGPWRLDTEEGSALAARGAPTRAAPGGSKSNRVGQIHADSEIRDQERGAGVEICQIDPVRGPGCEILKSELGFDEEPAA